MVLLMAILHIGIDDTDSGEYGGCTTYIGALLVERLSREKVEFIDYPNLIRLNPNIPFRTRGNAAVVLRLKISDNYLEKIKDIVINVVENFSMIKDPKTNPGIVFYNGSITDDLKNFYYKAVRGFVTLDEAIKLIKKHNMHSYKIKKGLGIIGATAGIGADLTKDYTFELLAYRYHDHREKIRKIDSLSVKIMDLLLGNVTFNNYDYFSKRVLISPHGLDPVLFGVRGEYAECVYIASKLIQAYEPIERWVIFRTNQGTDAHMTLKKISELKEYDCGIIEGVIEYPPRVIQGGHTFFVIKDNTGSVTCAVYAPTGMLNKVARMLCPGDTVRVFGSLVRKNNVINFNVEKMEILSLAKKYVLRNPRCPKCGKTMTSAGKNKGFKCKNCGYKTKNLTKVKVNVPRSIKIGIYVSDKKAQRHLTKPIERYDIRLPKPSIDRLIDLWHFP